ncbi:MAG: transposase [Candidatus Aquilonibacter sp.]
MHSLRLYPTLAQERALGHALHLTRNLYNDALDQRKYEYRAHGRAVTSSMQGKELTSLRASSPSDAGIYRELQEATLHRLDNAFRAFFSRCKKGEPPGFPRFKNDARWNQLEYPHGDRAVKLVDGAQAKMRLPGIGFVRLRKGREVPSNYGRVFITRKAGRWYATFECKRKIAPMAASGREIGIDAGITAVLATSNGDLIENPRHANTHRARVESAARSLDAATEKDARGHVLNRRDPHRRAKARALARAKEREANARRDFLHKVSSKLVRENDLIAMEKLGLRNMTRSAKGTADSPGSNVAAKAGLNRAMLDTGFGMLRRMIAEKAEWAARAIAVVDPKYTSQMCFACKHVAANSRDGTRFACVACGHSDHADVNAARNILAKAQWAPQSVLSSGDAGLTLEDVA